MKKNLNLEEILDYIAVEEAPRELIYRWKTEVQLRKERKRFFAVLLRPSIVFPLLLSGFWYYLTVFKKELFEYYLTDRLRSFFMEVIPFLANSTYNIASSYYYIIGAGIFSVFLAAVSLFWFYQGKRLRYSIIRNW
jgi:hypothetical protein